MLSNKVLPLIILIIFLILIIGYLIYYKEGWRWGRGWGWRRGPYWGRRPYRGWRGWGGPVYASPDVGNCKCINDETVENNCDYGFKPFCNNDECVCG